MSQPWPVVPLGEVLTHRKEFIEIDDLQTYKRCRVQLHAQGIVLRDTVAGAEIKTKKQQVCKAGEFLVAEIDAKLGGFGIVPLALEGAVVSSHYFLYQVNEEKLDRRFLGYFICTPDFRDQVTAQGSTNYAAIRPHDVLRYKMPLPSPEEQRRIVAKIEALAAKIEEASGLRAEAEGEADALLDSTRAEAFKNAIERGTTRLDLITTLERGKFAHRPRNEPRFFGGEQPRRRTGTAAGVIHAGWAARRAGVELAWQLVSGSGRFRSARGTYFFTARRTCEGGVRTRSGGASR